MDYRVSNAVKEYAASLNDDELKSLFMRLDQNFTGDMAEAVSLLERNEGVDHYLRQARSFVDFWGMLDAVCQCLEYEMKRRGR